MNKNINGISVSQMQDFKKAFDSIISSVCFSHTYKKNIEFIHYV